jgi:hypothetical protein
MEKIKSEIRRLQGLGFTYASITKHVNDELAKHGGLSVSVEGIRMMTRRNYVRGISAEKRAAILAVGRRFK